MQGSLAAPWFPLYSDHSIGLDWRKQRPLWTKKLLATIQGSIDDTIVTCLIVPQRNQSLLSLIPLKFQLEYPGLPSHVPHVHILWEVAQACRMQRRVGCSLKVLNQVARRIRQSQ